MFDSEKALNTLLYITKALGKTGFHKAFKVMYFAERDHLASYGSPLLDDSFIKMKNGPVPSSVYEKLKAMRGGNNFTANDIVTRMFNDSLAVEDNHYISGKREPDLDFFSTSEIESLNGAIEYCRDKSFDCLSNLSHDSAWEQAPVNRAMSTFDIAKAGGADETMIAYIRSVFENESALSECPF